MDAANDAVNCLDKASLTELKSFAKPPAGVDKVTTALLIMIKVRILVLHQIICVHVNKCIGNIFAGGEERLLLGECEEDDGKGGFF
jgi:hypothetical protein